MRTDKKYTMIVTQKDERYGKEKQLDFYSDNPWEGDLSDIVFGDTIEELSKSSDGHDNEGLFYILYANDSGKRIGSGTVDYDSIQEEIEEYEEKFLKETITEEIYDFFAKKITNGKMPEVQLIQRSLDRPDGVVFGLTNGNYITLNLK